MTTSGARSAAVRELLVVIGLAVAGLLLAVVVTFATYPFDAERPVFAPVVEVWSPDGPLT